MGDQGPGGGRRRRCHGYREVRAQDLYGHPADQLEVEGACGGQAVRGAVELRAEGPERTDPGTRPGRRAVAVAIARGLELCSADDALGGGLDSLVYLVLYLWFAVTPVRGRGVWSCPCSGEQK